MTTTTYTPDSNDNYCLYGHATSTADAATAWATARGTYYSRNSSTTFSVGRYISFDDTRYGARCYRGFIAFTPTAEAASGTIRLYCTSGGPYGGPIAVAVLGFTEAALTNDTDSFNGYDTATYCGAFYTPDEAGYVYITLTQDGIDYINANIGGTVVLALVQEGCYSDSAAPALTNRSYTTTYGSPENATEDYRPLITLISTDTPSSQPPTWGEDVAGTPSHRHKAGSSVVYRCYSGLEGEALNPTSGAVTITDADGTEQVTDGAMTNTATGIMDYSYRIPAAAVKGTWTVDAILTYTSGADSFYVIKRHHFEVI